MLLPFGVALFLKFCGLVLIQVQYVWHPTCLNRTYCRSKPKGGWFQIYNFRSKELTYSKNHLTSNPLVNRFTVISQSVVSNKHVTHTLQTYNRAILKWPVSVFVDVLCMYIVLANFLCVPKVKKLLFWIRIPITWMFFYLDVYEYNQRARKPQEVSYEPHRIFVESIDLLLISWNK